jgi:cell volume regulation protein A
LLFGSIIGCTDAAAVFGILRSRRMMLRSGLGTMAELESATNDPMAVFLALALIEIIKTPGTSIWHLVPQFFVQMGLGSVVGLAMGIAIPWMINALNLAEDGLYPPLSLAFAILTYAAAAWIGGSGFLAAYIAGIVMNTKRYYHKQSIARFHSGFSWLMQIAMFVALGLLLKPTALTPLIGNGLIISLFILFVARPVSVFLTLAFSSLSWREKLMASWLGLRGAVPIILATLTLYSGLGNAQLIFDLVFFVVLLSVLVQGTTLTQVADWLKVLMPMTQKHLHKARSGAMLTDGAQLQEVIVPQTSTLCGHTVMSLGLSDDARVLLIHRDDEAIVPTGRTRIEGGDVLEILADDADMNRIRTKIEMQATA